MNENEILDQAFDDDLFKPDIAFINGLKSTLNWAFVLIILSCISQAYYSFETLAKSIMDPSSYLGSIYKYQMFAIIFANLASVYFLWRFHKHGKAYLDTPDEANLQATITGLSLFFMTTFLSWCVYYFGQYILGY